MCAKKLHLTETVSHLYIACDERNDSFLESVIAQIDGNAERQKTNDAVMQIRHFHEIWMASIVVNVCVFVSIQSNFGVCLIIPHSKNKTFYFWVLYML